MALVITAPLLLTILAVLMIALSSIYHITRADRLCKKEAFRLQHELSRLMKELTHLNRLAQSLRAQREVAEAQVVAANSSGYPPAIAAANAYRAAVILEQEALAVKQHALLAQAGSQRVDSKQRFSSEFNAQPISSSESRSLAVRPDPPQSLTPDYVPEAAFRDRQSQTYPYKLDLASHWPAVFKKFLDPRVLKEISTDFSTACAATLSNEENKWKPMLNKVNLSSRW